MFERQINEPVRFVESKNFKAYMNYFVTTEDFSSNSLLAFFCLNYD